MHRAAPLKQMEFFMKCVGNCEPVAFLCPLRLYWLSLHILKSEIKGGVLSLTILVTISKLCLIVRITVGAYCFNLVSLSWWISLTSAQANQWLFSLSARGHFNSTCFVKITCLIYQFWEVLYLFTLSLYAGLVLDSQKPPINFQSRFWNIKEESWQGLKHWFCFSRNGFPLTLKTIRKFASLQRLENFLFKETTEFFPEFK